MVDTDRKLRDSDLDARVRLFVYRHIIRREESPAVERCRWPKGGSWPGCGMAIG
jgi:hypothetical protein